MFILVTISFGKFELKYRYSIYSTTEGDGC